MHFQQPFDDVFVPNSLSRKDELRFRMHLPEFELQCVLGELKKVLQVIVQIARKKFIFTFFFVYYVNISIFMHFTVFQRFYNEL